VSIGDYVKLARRHFFILLFVPVLFAAVGFFVSNSEARVYRSSAQVLLRPNDPNERVGTSATGTEIQNADRIVKAQASIARGPVVRKQTAAALGNVSEREIQDSITVTPSTDSNVLNISADDISPTRASEIANAVSVAFIENRRLSAIAGLDAAISDLNKRLAEVDQNLNRLNKNPSDPISASQILTYQAQAQSLSDRRLGLSIDKELKRGESELIATAPVPVTPISPVPVRNAILAGAIGLMVASGFVVLKDRLDTRLRSREEAEDLSGLSTLAEIPVDRVSENSVGRVAAEDDPDGAVAEAIRSLRVSLRFLGLEQPVKVVLVTSALPGDGKSTVSTNLAYSFAESGARTLLVSADLRRPQVEHLVSASTDRGLVELLGEMAEARQHERGSSALRTPRARPDRMLIGAAAIESWCHQDTPNLFVLPAGRRIANPVEILGSAVAKEFFERAAEDFDVVIVDSPPVLAVADAIVLSQFADGVLVVTSLQKTQRDALSRTLEILRNRQTNLLGLVLNRVRSESSYGYYGYYGKPGSEVRSTSRQGSLSGVARRLAGRGRPSRDKRAA
jgi:Mrp family chromosome partitioning ATPase/capsular polysaccharide biosynthesis protein